ncbi:hypothetical protein [Petropleomorpha daqingensis]|uniref:Putative membrane protein n=1 Tax=Petropleomorpha daqingensis TaxID=2026353 RepID=A0A853CKA5_9ACTN|nr:hypothetical protein [Petropleomorpha daqingensis]NYJ07796.1 putative membrane protein [Petropleomorpha daqingensis]
MSDPWADPNAQAYAGPPATDPPPAPQPPPYGYPPYGYPGYPPYGYPPYGYPPVPAGPRRPGQVIAAAVLAFCQAAFVMVASIYVVLFSSLIDIAADADPTSAPPEEVSQLAGEGTVVGIVQVASAVLLIVAGVLALNSRRRRSLVVLVVGFAVQVLLCIYWAVRLSVIASEIPGSGSTSAFLAFALVFFAGPAVGLGLVLLGGGRRWFDTAR